MKKIDKVTPFELVPEDFGDRNVAGVVCAANESRFTSAHYSEPLTAFTLGWQDPENLDDLLEFLAPAVQVGRRFEFKQATNAESFLTETDDVRAIGSPFKEVTYTGASVLGKTLNKGLTIRVDHDEEIDDSVIQNRVGMLMQRLLRNEVKRHLVALAVAVTEGTPVWSADPDDLSNPDADIRAILAAATDDSGIRPNRLIIGEAAWDLRSASYEALANAGGFRSAGMSLTELAQKLLVDEVRVLKARYQSTAAAKAALLGQSVYAYFAMSGVGKDDPSNVKRFWSPARGGGRWGVYVVEHEKYTDVSVEHYSVTTLTSTLGLVGLSPTSS